ncbi:glutathione S-transferase, putative [Plesiocystis pacifica SIR-1]|uniref:Microsomal glutathione S-transferase 1 n=1 Tax=Plesiocystis pacifica SIR-1 TaxID=391625 RepID=A6GKC0_9BACT|nr:MAPEG family protein [Plesiocystis pacifica]EDM73679.1 glutathione S-transferase, putative [Plesiocystis pacifica SIR-1]
MNQEALDVYLLCTTALVLNLFFLVGVIGARRSKAKTFVNPEDADTFKGNLAEAEDPKAARALAAHRNALENIPLFLILGYLHVATGASQTSAIAYFVTFTVARWLHSIVYLRGLQPWRTALFSISFLAMLGIAVRLAIVALT